MVRWIAAGGALGSLARWQLLDPVGVEPFPWATLLVNVVGTVALMLAPRIARPSVRAGFAVGFCGGLTTVSTLAVEVTELVHRDALLAAGVYTVASMISGVAAVAAVVRLERAA